MSMLVVYYKLFPWHQKAMRRALYVVTAFTAASMLWTVSADTFWCGPDPSVNW